MNILSNMPESVVRAIRFLISGSTSTCVSLGTLYFCNSVLGMWYLAASVAGFFAGFVVSFTLHKFWTFRDHRVDRAIVGTQLARYIGLVLFNLALNTILVYLLVEYTKLVPVLAQALAALLIACESFFAYRFIVFNRDEHLPEPTTY